MPRVAYVQALLAILLWSLLAFLSVRLSHVPPFLLVGTALLLGSLCRAHKYREWRVPANVLLLGIYGLFGYHFCLFLALRLAPPLQANLINYLWPLLIVVLSPAFFPGRRLRSQHLIGALLGFAGAALIVSGGRFGFDSAYLPGYALAAAAAFLWSTYSLMSKRVGRFPNAAVGLFCLCAGALALLMHALLETPYAFAASDVPALLLLGFGPMGAAFFLWDASLKNGDPRVIGSLAYLTPLLSTVVLVLTRSSEFSAVAGLAMVLIVGGAVVGSLATRPAA